MCLLAHRYHSPGHPFLVKMLRKIFFFMTHSCSSRKCHEFQTRAVQVVGINNILEHLSIDSNFLDIIIDSSKD